MVQELPTKKCDRVVGECYMYKKELRYWNGKILLCEHKIRKNYCIVCGGIGLCKHKKNKQACKECGTGQCKHKRRKEYCIECGGSVICVHKRIKYQCLECNGSAICEHGRAKYSCKQCRGSRICEHGKRKEYCAKCGGSALCTICNFVSGRKRYIHKTDTFVLSCIDCFHNKYPDDCLLYTSPSPRD